MPAEGNVPDENLYSLYQFTFAHNGRHEVNVWQKHVTQDWCYALKAQKDWEWKFWGDKTAFYMVKYVCLPRYTTRVP